MSISAIGNTYSYIYNFETKKLTTTDGGENEFTKYFNGEIEGHESETLNGFDADAYRESLRSGKHSAVRESTSSDNGRAIGVTTVGNIGYVARYADSSTTENPVIKIGDYEVLVNEVDPQNATQIEMFALMSYLDDTNQTNNTGMSSFSKLRSHAELAEMNGLCKGIQDVNGFFDKNQNWEEIMQAIKEVFLGNPQTYEQALNCEKLISVMEGTYEYC